jgi:hypothetical protein
VSRRRAEPKFLVWVLPLVVTLTLAVLGMRGCQKGQTVVDQKPPRGAPDTLPHPTSEPQAVTVAAPNPTPRTRSPSPGPPMPRQQFNPGMTLMQVAFQNGKLVEVERTSAAEATVRPLRRLEGERGLYFRITDSAGKVLFEDLVADPREVHWDTTDDGRKLRGGRLDNAAQPAQLRFPLNVKGTLEVYALSRMGWTRETFSQDAVMVGRFSL